MPRGVPGPRGADNSPPLRGFRAIALLSVFFKWYTTVLMDRQHEEKEPFEWRNLHVQAERGVNCEHMQALLTNILDRFGARILQIQDGLRGEPGHETSFDVAKPSVVSKVLSLTGSPRTRGGGSACRAAGCSRIGLL